MYRFIMILSVFIVFASKSFAGETSSVLNGDELKYVQLDEYVVMARDGNYADAITGLSKLYSANRKDQKILGDYITVLSWDNQYNKAAGLVEDLTENLASDYVLVSAGLALRKSGKSDKAIEFYKTALIKYPNNLNLISGLVFTYIDMSRFENAEQEIKKSEKLLKANKNIYSEITSHLERAKQNRVIEEIQIKAINLAGKEQYAEAIKILDELHNKYPKNNSVLYDYITVLNWSENFKQSSKLAKKVNIDIAPDYALAAVAESYRKMGDVDKGYEIYKKGVEKYPENFNLVVGLAISTAEFSNPDNGYSIFAYYVEQNPGLDRKKIIEVERYFFSIGAAVKNFNRSFDNIALKKLLRSSAEYNKSAENKSARIEKIEQLNALNAFYMSSVEASKTKNIKNKTRHDISNNLYMQKARWAVLQKEDEKRQKMLNDNIDGINKLLAACARNSICKQDILKTRMFTYAVAGDNDKVAADYETLRAEKVFLNNEYLFSVASSFMQAKRPADAKTIYQDILKRENNSKQDETSAKNGMFWSNLELDNIDEAKEIVQNFASDMKINIAECSSSSDVKVPLYENYFEDARYTDILNGQALLYTNNSECAQYYFENILEKAPGDDAAYSALAETLAIRGQPLNALKNINIAKSFYKNPSFELQEANFYIASSQWEKADKIIQNWQENRPYNIGFERVKETWDIHNMHELSVYSGWSNTNTSDPAVTPDEGISVDTTLYSKPFFYNWRIYAGYRFATGEFEEGKATQRRYALGTQYRGLHLDANFEVSYDNTIENDIGGAFFGTVKFDDYWSMPFRVSVNSVNTPLRAIRSGITADDAGLGIQYEWNDYRSISANINTFRFSDGNDRLELYSSFSQRLLTIDEHTLTGNIYLYNSYNSEDENRPYFNPKKDFSGGFGLVYNDLLWRNYDYSLHHRIEVGAGIYNQKGFGSDLNYNIGYAQSWSITPRFYTEYGYTYSRPVYDGEPETDHNFFLNLVWRF